MADDAARRKLAELLKLHDARYASSDRRAKNLMAPWQNDGDKSSRLYRIKQNCVRQARIRADSACTPTSGTPTAQREEQATLWQ